MHVRIEFANLVEKLIIRVLQVSGVRHACHASILYATPAD